MNPRSLSPPELLPGPVSPLFTTLLLVLLLGSCASWQPPAEFDDSSLRAHAVTGQFNNVLLKATLLSAEDSRRMFGVDVVASGVQPVWIEVENRSGEVLWLLRAGTDPEYFSPLEVAWSFHTTLGRDSNNRMDDYFDAQGFQNPIASGETRSGIIFTNPHHQTMLLNVDLVGPKSLFPFTLFPPVPGHGQQAASSIQQRTSDMDAIDYLDEARFRGALEQLACCAGSTAGDALNLVIVGEIDNVASALVRRGYRRREFAADLQQRVFGRPPDVVARKIVSPDRIARWVRLWVAPVRYRGAPVLLGQIGRLQGAYPSDKDDSEAVLHPDVDEARNLLIQDLFYSGGLGKLGFVKGAKSGDQEDTRYHTDGLRAVLFLEARPLAISDVQFLDWEPYLRELERAKRDLPIPVDN